MRVLSVFDGMSCGQIALERAGIKVDRYYASEIDKHAIKVTMANYPNTIQLGDVTSVRACDLGVDIDLLIGGSPCQGFSFAGKGLNFNDPRSKLFFEFVRLLNEIRAYNPKVLFLLENVKMKKEHQDVITEYLGVEPIMINSALVCAQNRKRLYWTNIPGVIQPEDRGIVLADIIESGSVDREKSYCIDANYFKGGSLKNYLEKSRRKIDNFAQSEKRLMVAEKAQTILSTIYKENAKSMVNRGKMGLVVGEELYLNDTEIDRAVQSHAAKTWHTGNKMGAVKFPTDINGKAKTLTAVTITGNRAVNHIQDGIRYRKLTPLECERLQTVPVGYTNHVSNTQRYRMLGNGWTVDVISHIFSFIPCQKQ